MQTFPAQDEITSYDLVLQAYEELSTFSEPPRGDLLHRVHRALPPSGAFAFDVSTPRLHPREQPQRSW